MSPCSCSRIPWSARSACARWRLPTGRRTWTLTPSTCRTGAAVALSLGLTLPAARGTYPDPCSPASSPRLPLHLPYPNRPHRSSAPPFGRRPCPPPRHLLAYPYVISQNGTVTAAVKYFPDHEAQEAAVMGTQPLTGAMWQLTT